MALFDGCTIVPKGKPDWGIAAFTPEVRRFGCVFRCMLQRGEGARTAYLDRSWRPFACTVFLQSNRACPSCRPVGTIGTSPMPTLPLTAVSSAASVPVPHRKSAWRGRIACPVTGAQRTSSRRFLAADGRSPDFARSGDCACFGHDGANLSDLKGRIQPRFQAGCDSRKRRKVPTTNCPIDAASDRWSQS